MLAITHEACEVPEMPGQSAPSELPSATGFLDRLRVFCILQPYGAPRAVAQARRHVCQARAPRESTDQLCTNIGRPPNNTIDGYYHLLPDTRVIYPLHDR